MEYTCTYFIQYWNIKHDMDSSELLNYEVYRFMMLIN